MRQTATAHTSDAPDPVTLLRDMPLPFGRAQASIGEEVGTYLQVGGLTVHYRHAHVEAVLGHQALSTRDARMEGRIYQSPDGRLGLVASRDRSRVIILAGHCQVEVNPLSGSRARAQVHAPCGGAVVRPLPEHADLPALPLAIIGQGEYASEVHA